jgi:hypothetical protein
MAIQFDPKGKHFTEVVAKIPQAVVIETTRGRIRGTIHVHPDHRLLDELNEEQAFVAITEAEIELPEGNLRASFVAVGKAELVWITPVEELSGGAHEP